MRKFEKLLAPLARPSTPGRGDAGYDNPRENIDPQVKTQVVYAREIVLGGVRKAAWPTSSGHVIEDEGVELTQRDNINFTGAGVTATDAGGKTVVTIPGSAGAVDSVFGRAGDVVAVANDYTWTEINKTVSDIADIATKSHTSLTDIGTKTHAQIDTHLNGDGSDHANVVTNSTHTAGDGSDHADVATNTTHIGLSNPHSGSAASGANSDITSITGLTTDLAIAHGGTSQSTAQLAINALSAVAGATNEHVLTKDTATGNAIFKAAAGGAAGDMSYWNADINDKVEVAGTWAPINTGNQSDWDSDLLSQAGIYGNSATDDNLDEIHFGNLTLNAGTYVFKVASFKGSAQGIMELIHGTTSLGTSDMYSAGDTWNSVQTFTYTPTTRVTGNLRFRVNGKHASATTYRMYCSRIEYVKTV